MADFQVVGETKLDGSGLKQGLSAATVAGGQLLSDFAQKAITQLGNVVQSGINFNAQMETYITNFTTMLNGNAEAAQGLVGELQELGASTPLAITDLTNAAQTLLAFGAADAGTMTDTLRMIGDVALGDANKMQSLSLAYGQMVSTGKLQGQDLLQMINAGFNPLQELSEMGYGTVADLKDKMSKGAISVEMVEAAFKHATSEGGKFYGAMDAASKTFDGQMSTLKDNATALMGALSEGIFEGLSETVMPMAVDAVDQLSTAFAEDGYSGLFDAGCQIIGGLIDSLLEAAPAALEGLLTLAAQMIDNVATGLLEHGPQMVEAGGQILMDLVAGIMQGLPQLLQAGLNLIGSLLQTVVTTFPSIIKLGGDLLMQVLTGLWAALPDLLRTAGQIIVRLIQTIVQKFPEILRTGFDLIVRLITGIGNAMPKVIDAAGDVIASIWDSIKQTDWLKLGKDIIQGVIDGIGSMAGALWEAAKGVAGSALDAAKRMLHINSPSRRARDEIGKPFVQGMTVGIEKETPEAAKASEASAESMVRSARRAVMSSQQMTGSTIASTGSGAQAALSASWHGESTTIIEMDGREVARATAPYIDEQLDL